MSDPALNKKLARKISESIDKDIEAERQQRIKEKSNIFTIFVLGSSDAGKSTLLKQMLIMHKGGFNEAQIASYRSVIYNNLFDVITALLNTVFNVLKLAGKNIADLVELKEQFLQLNRIKDAPLDARAAKIIRDVWAHPTTRYVVTEYRSKIDMQDTAEYFLNGVDRITSPDFTPTNEDIINARLSTYQITEYRIPVYSQCTLHMYDAGGQRTLRQRWVPYFSEDLGSLMFVVSLAGYDQVLMEDPTANRMVDAIELFKQVCVIEVIHKVPMILFLNKLDLFKKKIFKSPIVNYFPEFTGGTDYKEGVQYFRDALMENADTKNRQFYCHTTTATSTSMMRKIFETVFDSILSKITKALM